MLSRILPLIRYAFVAAFCLLSVAVVADKAFSYSDVEKLGPLPDIYWSFEYEQRVSWLKQQISIFATMFSGTAPVILQYLIY